MGVVEGLGLLVAFFNQVVGKKPAFYLSVFMLFAVRLSNMLAMFLPLKILYSLSLPAGAGAVLFVEERIGQGTYIPVMLVIMATST